jgi:CheY-like chemotaxis protein
MKDMNQNKEILVIEDDEDDFIIFKRAFKKSACTNPIRRFESGDEALVYFEKIKNRSTSEDCKVPGIILLDLNMPGTDGRTLLKILKADEFLKKIPVIVMTTSEDPNDINQCFAEGANAFTVKPNSFAGFIEAIKSLNKYWFDMTVLPKLRLSI